ncbi:ISAon1 family transposase [Pedobacter changchengzhani]|uniref:ISAon1 family transposase n=1 Tax=Pedobacter changchengzhani TaxID=2529274 RepID=UPI001A9E7127|nr:transposase [Pedobacter changchengzhani]
MQVDTRPDTITNIASYFQVSSDKLQRHYKHRISGYKQWDQLSHADDYLIFPENITDRLSIDEVSLSKGELYTFITNKNAGIKNRGSIVAVINGTQAKLISEVLDRIPLQERSRVKEVSMDMARNMGMAVRNSFANCNMVIDRFHVVRLVMDAMQHIRVSFRWEAIDLENREIKEAKEKGIKYIPQVLANGDTLKELLARSRYLLYKFEEDWTVSQKKRATVLFEKYPILKSVYQLTLSFRNIYKNTTKSIALDRFNEWKQKVEDLKMKEFNTVLNSIENHMENILNFFDNRSTNANAESFNSKIKLFRANLRGVTDPKFFLFRLGKLFA